MEDEICLKLRRSKPEVFNIERIPLRIGYAEPPSATDNPCEQSLLALCALGAASCMRRNHVFSLGFAFEGQSGIDARHIGCGFAITKVARAI